MANMKLKGRTLLFFVTVVPCLPLICVIILLLQKQAPSYHHAHVNQGDRNRWDVLPKQLVKHVNEGSEASRHQELERHDTRTPCKPADTIVEDDFNPELLDMSENLDIEARGKFQRDQISRMCREHFFTREQRLPHSHDLPPFFRHLMFDDKRKAIFCFVPKIGCTDMKRLMLYMGGHLPMDTVDWPWVEDKYYLEPALSKTSFLNKTLLLSEKIQRLKTYYKFMIVRNPLERLVSAYRNKIEGAVSYTLQDHFPHNLRITILEQYHEAELAYWRRTNTGGNIKLNISVTFPDFVRHFVETDVANLNDHYRPTIDICHPCIARFDFYGNFRNFSTDVAQLIKKFHTEPRFYRDQSLHSSSEQTSRLLTEYYRRLSHRDKVQLLGKLYDDLLFYYTLYPADRHSHYHLLGIKHPVL